MSFKLTLLAAITSVGVTACISNQYSKPSNLRFQEKNHENTQAINIKRDGKLCAGDTPEKQNCPVSLYIDGFQSGTFYINNSAQYFLKSENYNFKVKNCTANECMVCDVDLSKGALSDSNFILSVEDSGKPIIINSGTELKCSADEKSTITPKELMTQIHLAADTLFMFNGSSLNDLLPKGRQEILDLSSKIKNEYVSVTQIRLVGHTDRLGSDIYNQDLGQKRANTVRNLLIQNGVSEQIVFASSTGKREPVTDGCMAVQAKEDLRECLQADRRVSVEITGISK